MMMRSRRGAACERQRRWAAERLCRYKDQSGRDAVLSSCSSLRDESGSPGRAPSGR